MAKRFYAPFHTWEDYQNGMFGSEIREDYSNLSASLMSDIKPAMLRVINEWPISTRHNLTNAGSNRKSWLGQAACCINHGATEFETRLAWRLLPKETQFAANKSAQEVIEIWELQNNFNKNDYIKEDFTL
jgi:hypothetical protein